VRRYELKNLRAGKELRSKENRKEINGRISEKASDRDRKQVVKHRAEAGNLLRVTLGFKPQRGCFKIYTAGQEKRGGEKRFITKHERL